MAGIQMITDPTDTNGSGTAQSGAVVFDYPATAAVTAHQLVALTCDDTGAISVAPADTDTHDPAVKVGAALNSAAIGEIVSTVVFGPALIDTPATGPSLSEVLILTSTAGTGDGAAADATTVAGDTHGVFLTDEVGTTNRSWVWIS